MDNDEGELVGGRDAQEENMVGVLTRADVLFAAYLPIIDITLVLALASHDTHTHTRARSFCHSFSLCLSVSLLASYDGYGQMGLLTFSVPK